MYFLTSTFALCTGDCLCGCDHTGTKRYLRGERSVLAHSQKGHSLLWWGQHGDRSVRGQDIGCPQSGTKETTGNVSWLKRQQNLKAHLNDPFLSGTFYLKNWPQLGRKCSDIQTDEPRGGISHSNHTILHSKSM